MRAPATKALVAHVVYRFGMGGLENGLVNIINRMPDRYRHVIVCLNGFTDFKDRIQRPDVQIINAKVSLGTHFFGHLRLFHILRRLHPQILHTRNIATIEANLSAALLAVPVRIHGEHGRDSYDPTGANRKYKAIRRIVSPAIHRFVAVNRDLASWVAEDVGIDRMRIVTISNGVDTSRFHPPDVPSRSRLRESLGFSPEHLVVGFVGRFEPIKDPLNLVQAFVRLMHTRPDCRDRVRLVMVGDGSLRTECIRVLRDAGLYDLAFLPGARNDIPDLLRSFDAFVLPSQGEGMSNTILEAMASGLPVVATDVGGNRELVAERQTGFLVPAADPGALAKALEKYLEPGALASQQGVNARTRIEADFSIDRMVASYTHLYDSLLGATKN